MRHVLRPTRANATPALLVPGKCADPVCLFFLPPATESAGLITAICVSVCVVDCGDVTCAENAVCTGVNNCTCQPGYKGDGVTLCVPGTSKFCAACLNIPSLVTAVGLAILQCVISRRRATAPPQMSASVSRPTPASVGLAGSAAVSSASLVCCVMHSQPDGAHRLASGV
jgi:hypothetical protein